MISWIKLIPVLINNLMDLIKGFLKISKTIQRKDPEQIVVDNAEVIEQVKNADTKEKKRAAARAVAKRINKL